MKKLLIASFFGAYAAQNWDKIPANEKRDLKWGAVLGEIIFLVGLAVVLLVFS